MLYLHDRTRITEPLPAQQAAAIMAVFGSPAGPSDAFSRRLAASSVADIRERELWLACGCTDDPVAGRPLMSPRRLPTGMVTLVRHGSAQHAADCRLRQVGEGSTRSDRLQIGTLEGWGGVPQRLMPAPPPMLDDLLVLLQACGYTMFDPALIASSPRSAAYKAPDILSAYQQIDTAEDVMLGDAARTRLGDVGCFSMARFSSTCARLAGAGVARGVLFAVAHQVRHEGDAAVLSWASRQAPERPIEVAVDHPWIAAHADSEGPWWVLGSFDPASRRVSHCVAMPMYGRGWLMPMLTQDDRMLVDFLVDQLRYWQRAEIPAATLECVLPPGLDYAACADYRIHAGDACLHIVHNRLSQAPTADYAPFRRARPRVAAMIEAGIPADSIATLTLLPDNDDRRRLTGQWRRCIGRSGPAR